MKASIGRIVTALDIAPGVMDIGPAPVEPLPEDSGKIPEKVESFREKALRRAKEAEAREVAGCIAFDHWGTSACATPEYKAEQEARNRSAALNITTPKPGAIPTMTVRGAMRYLQPAPQGQPDPTRNGPSHARVYVDSPAMTNEQVLIVQFGQIGGASALFTPRMSAREIANALHRLAHRIEMDLCR